MNTKRYDIIHIDGRMYVVDKKAKESYPWAIHIKRQELLKIEGVGEKSSEHHHDKGWNNSDELWKVVGSSDSSLGLPLLPSIESTLTNEECFDICQQVWGEKGYPYYDYNKIVSALKIAAKAKKYSEEDMRKALALLQKHTGVDNDGEHCYSTMSHDSIIQSLNPLPIAVEVEMVPDKVVYIDYPSDTGGFVTSKPEVDNNNTIIVKQWIWNTE